MLYSPPTTDSLPPGGSIPHTPDWQPAKYTRAPKPAGGFALLPVLPLVLSWMAHEQGVIEPLALRGYLACIELRERRCGAAPETPTHYTTEELRHLLGATVRPSAAAAVRQALVAVGLITWPDDGHQFALCPQGTTVPWLDLPRYTALRAAIHPSVQQLPLPRRLLTWLAAEGAPGLIATVLGVACRALRYRDHHVIAGGSLVPAWVAETFQIARRTVAHWLQRLRALHWLTPVATPRAHRQAYGPWVAINLRWAPPGAAVDTTRASQPHACSTKSGSTSPVRSPAPTIRPPTDVPHMSTDACPSRPPVHDTPILQPHKTLDRATNPSVSPGGTAGATAASDPPTHYATLPLEVQATLYQEAETRLLQHYPRAFVIRPTVLAEIYRALEMTAMRASEAPPPGAVSPPPTVGYLSSADTNLATSASSGCKNLASTSKNLANSSSPSPPEALEFSSVSPIPWCPHGNPVPDTQPHKHHENLCGDGVGVQRKDRSEGDPAPHYATLPSETQATLYHDAEARLRPQVPAALLIRPVVLAEVSRLLETPRAHPRPTPPIPRQAHGVMSTPRRPAIPGAATPSSSPHPLRVPPGAPGEGPAPPAARGVPSPRPPRKPPARPPRLADITPTDLADVTRLAALWQHAQGRGWIGGSDADWLTVVAAAQHALRVGHNPGGLFVAVLRQQAWHLITQTDEDAARQTLRAAQGPLTSSERHVLRRLFGRGGGEPARPHVPPLSLDAQYAREALRVCHTAQWRGDPFTVVKAAEPEWTRARWDAACAALEHWQLLQQVANAQQQVGQVPARAYDETEVAVDEPAWEHDGDHEP